MNFKHTQKYQSKLFSTLNSFYSALARQSSNGSHPSFKLILCLIQGQYEVQYREHLKLNVYEVIQFEIGLMIINNN